MLVDSSNQRFYTILSPLLAILILMPNNQTQFTVKNSSSIFISMKKISLAIAIFAVSFVSANTFAQQAKTPLTPQPSISTNVAPAKGASKVPTVSQEAINTSSNAAPKSAKPTEGYNVDNHMSRDKRADTRISRVEQRVGTLTAEQKTKLKALFLAEFDQLEQAKATLSPENKNPFGAIRKKTDEQILAMLSPEQLTKYTTPTARKSAPQTSNVGVKVNGTATPAKAK